MTTPAADYILDVDQAEFEREVLERSLHKPVIVDFWAPWCEPCRRLGPDLEAVVEERGGDVVLAKVNIDQNPQLAEYLGIESIPAVKVFRSGRLLTEFVGVYPREALRQLVEKLCPTAAERTVQQASAHEKRDPRLAEKEYRDALAQDPNQEDALLGLARILVARNDDTESSELLARIPPGGDHAAEVSKLTSLVSLRRLAKELPNEATARTRAQDGKGQALYELGVVLAAAAKYPEALQSLVSAAERDRKLGADKVREAMVMVFHIVGPRSDLADEYRDKLTRLLY